MQKLYAHSWLPEDIETQLKKRFDLLSHNAHEKILSEKEFNISAKGVNGVISQGNKINSEYFSQNKNTLKIIANVGVGFDNIDIDSANKNSVIVTNTPGVLDMAVSDMTMGLILAIARRIPEGDIFTKSGGYKGNPFPLLWGADLAGEKIGIIGMGRIGRELAKRAKAFNMNITYYNRKKLSFEIESKYCAVWNDLSTLLKTSKYVVILCPLNKDSYQLIGKSELEIMRKDSFIINIARGKILNELALVEALISKKIAGAALDVFENEPYFDKRLADMKNVILTPHAGSATISTRPSMIRLAASNILAYFSGGKVPNIINKEFI